MVRSPKHRFYLDENFPVSTGKFLASKGHNVTYALTAQRGKLRGASDYAQLRFSSKEERILVTYDRDFLQNHLARLIQRSPGVIAVRGDVTEALLKKILNTISHQSLQGKLCRAGIDSITIVNPTSAL